MIWVGAISYEMYLWHWPTYLVITPDRTGLSGAALLLVRLSAVVALAAVTHFYVAEPIRRGERFRTPNVARWVTAAAIIAISVGVFAATVGARPALSGDAGQVADRSGPPSVPATPAPTSGGAGTPAATSPPQPLKVLVVGDSQAATLAQGFEADPGHAGLSAQSGLAVWNRAILACSIITVDSFSIDGDRAENGCGGNGVWQRQWAGDVTAFDPDVVVVQAGAWDIFDVANADGSVTRPGNASWVEGYTRDVEALLDTLAAKGASVVAIRPPCYGNNEIVGSGPTPAVRLDRARLDAVDAVWATATAARGADLLDLDPMLCPGGQSDTSIRPDGAHYSTDGANRVSLRVAEEIRTVAAEQALVAGS